MADYRFTELLRAFSREEIESLREYIYCDYFNTAVMQRKIFDILYGMYPAFPAGRELKEVLGNALYKKDFKDNNLRKQLFTFTKIIEKFILLKLSKSRKLDDSARLLAFYRARGLHKNFNSLFTVLSAEMEIMKNKDVNFYYDRAFIEKEYFNYQTDNLEISLVNCDRIMENTDMYFVLSSLDLYYNILKHKESFNINTEISMPFYEDIMAYVDKNEHEIINKHPNAYTSYLALMTITEPENIWHYKKLKAYLKKSEKDLAEYLIKDVFIVLYNYCSNKINKGYTSFREEIFDIMKGLDRRNMTTGFFSAFDLYFLSVINVGINLKEYDWVEYFINKYEKDIPASSRKDLISICRANLLFCKKKYGEALELLVKVKNHNPFYYIQSNCLIFKIYYEKNELEPMISLYDAMKHFIKRSPLGRSMTFSYENLLKYTLKLAKTGKNEEFELMRLKQQIEGEKVLNSKDWLMEKVRSKEELIT